MLARSSLPLISAASFAGRRPPDRVWAWGGLVPHATVTLLSGAGGTGKTLLTLQLAIAATLGSDLLGRAVRRGPAIVVTAEDDRDELHRRVAAIAEADGIDLAGLDDLHLVPLTEAPATHLAIEGDGGIAWTPTWTELTASVRRILPALIILDPVAELFGGKEIDRAQVAAFLSGLRRLAVEVGAAVVLVTHPSVAGAAEGSGRSGSTAWANGARQRLFFDRPDKAGGSQGDHSARVLKVTKANYAPNDTEIACRFDRGRFVQTVAAPPEARATEDQRIEGVFLRLLDKLAARGETFTPGLSRSSAAVRFSRDPDCEGIGPKVFEAAANRLLDRGVLALETVGPASKSKQILKRKGGA